MVLEMLSENRQCQCRGNMGGQLVPDPRCSGRKRFWSGHWCFPKWCRYGYGREGPEWSWRYVSWKNLSKVQRLLVVQYLESSFGNFEINSMANRQPVQAGQNWRDAAVPRLLCDNSSQGVLNHLKASKVWCRCACKKRIAIADYCNGYHFLLLQWSEMNECGAELECESMMPYKSRKHAYRKKYESPR